jgi:hypothetical protein
MEDIISFVVATGKHFVTWRFCALVLTLFAAPACADGPEFPPTPDDQPRERAYELSAPDRSDEIEKNKSYIIPALDIVGFDLLVNQFNRHVTNEPTADVTIGSIEDNLHSTWVIDNDPFQVNQLGHPYQGSMYHGFARSAGLNYWQSLLYTLAGSVLWEIAGETTTPSKNDQISTGIGGTFLGEPLFRMANLIIENADGRPSFWRETGAALVSPATGFNRLAFGDRFDTPFASRNAIFFSRFQFGFMRTAQDTRGSSGEFDKNEASADYMMEYGLPGKPGYEYSRPFDYFNFQATASSANVLENVMSRGLLIGKAYKAGESYRGVWGLYGSYDYISPQTFRVSSTALSLGTSAQWWLGGHTLLQGTALLGTGYAAVGTINGNDENDYHYGVAPQALLALRAIFSDRASLDVTAREYFVTDIGSFNTGGHDNIARADIALMWRMSRYHGLAVKYLWNRRDAFYPDLGDRSQTRGTYGIYYTYLGHDRFGAMDWR